ncbi:hypothetical protein ARALYDRAFT_917534 [Arabidopsis lyrata subsp. lyrata]|uniref:Uncharacterized protein n=1 Tax=Arabidopsis lyrata subsp. lyrata TaxID=81972 RepID=D7MSU0_ARALL|nr:hypothetical protein ARALYDRAFT_917534 [Arabidopsis lyrata subsp. lyrata]
MSPYYLLDLHSSSPLSSTSSTTPHRFKSATTYIATAAAVSGLSSAANLIGFVVYETYLSFDPPLCLFVLSHVDNIRRSRILLFLKS